MAMVYAVVFRCDNCGVEEMCAIDKKPPGWVTSAGKANIEAAEAQLNSPAGKLIFHNDACANAKNAELATPPP